jgi:nucleotide-binding universal stress UspA family protein
MVPMTGSIICGVDGSESAKGAVRVARELSTLLERRLVFVHVVEPGTPDEKIDAIAERLQRLADSEFRSDRAAALWLVDVGHPADRLVVAAEDEKASLIVVGSDGPRSSLLGSVSAEVSRRAPCPVVVVPPGSNATANDSGGSRVADGIARFALGAVGGQTELVGGIARFDLGAAVGATSETQSA